MSAQVIGTIITTGDTLTIGLGAGFVREPIETQAKVLEMVAQFIAKTAQDIAQEAEALKEGAKADAVDVEGAPV